MNQMTTQESAQLNFIHQVQIELECEDQDDLLFTLNQLRKLKQRVGQLKIILSEIHEIKKIPFEVYSNLL
jgi:hypothetical protein